MTYILVTGGCGFIASNFLNIMKEKYPHYKFINLDYIDYCSNELNVKPGTATLVKGDIRDEDLLTYLIKQYDFETVFVYEEGLPAWKKLEYPLNIKSNTLQESIYRFHPWTNYLHQCLRC